MKLSALKERLRWFVDKVREGLVGPPRYPKFHPERVEQTFILPLSSNRRLLGTNQLIARPQVSAFRVESIDIRNPERWIIEDIYIGNCSQFASSGPIPGEALVKMKLKLETVQTAMDFRMVVRYAGSDEDGERFYASAVGKGV